MRKLLVLFTLLGLSACSYNYRISEQDINQYLQSQIGFEQELGIPGLMSLQVASEKLNVVLGQRANRAQVSGQLRLKLESPVQNFDAKLATQLSAEPWYKPSTGEVFLRQIEVESFDLEPLSLKQQLEPFLPQINLALNQLLSSQAIYRLDDNNEREALAKRWTEELSIEPGEIVIKLAP